MKMLSNDAAKQRVRERHYRHALMVGHVRTDDCDGLAVGEPIRREIECLEIAESSQRADGAERAEIGGGGARVDHCGERS